MARPIHFELSTIDPARAITFYKAVFGWTIEPAGGPWEYYLITTGTDPEPGINGAISRSRDGTVGTVNPHPMFTIAPHLYYRRGPAY
jgi:uncharacterized protein